MYTQTLLVHQTSLLSHLTFVQSLMKAVSITTGLNLLQLGFNLMTSISIWIVLLEVLHLVLQIGRTMQHSSVDLKSVDLSLTLLLTKPPQYL